MQSHNYTILGNLIYLTFHAAAEMPTLVTGADGLLSPITSSMRGMSTKLSEWLSRSNIVNYSIVNDNMLALDTTYA